MTALLHDERGVSMTEYAMVIALVALVAIVALTAIGTAVCGAPRELTARMGDRW